MNKPAVLIASIFLCAGSAPLLAGTLPATLEVYDIQGNAPTSAHAGATVTVPNSVVTAVLANGFFLQTPDARADQESSLTSNGIRVVTAGAPTYSGGGAVAVGHRATVTGTVVETDTETRLSASTVTRVGADIVALPAAVELSAASGKPRASADNLYCYNNLSNFECFEGMRVTLPEGVVAAGSLAGGDLYVSPLGTRSMREKGVRFGNTVVAGNDLAGIWDGNPEVLRLDPNRLGAAGGGGTFVGGAEFSATGVLTVEDGNYEIWPSAFAVDAPTNVLPQPLSARPFADSFRVASFDTGALCDAVANTAEACPSVANKVSRLAAYIATVLAGPDVVALQNVENATILTELATAVTAAVGGGAVYQGHLVEGTSPDGLDQAFLVNTSRISGVSVSVPTELNVSALFTMPPLLLEATYGTTSFAVLNVHIDDRTGVDSGNAAARQRRFDQAEAIAEHVQTLQSGGGASRPLLVAGKFNGWNSTDGYVDVVGLVEGTYFDPENLLDVTLNPVSPLLRDIVELSPEQERITATTTESFGAVQNVSNRTIVAAYALDHILLTDAAKKIAMYADIGRGNADAAAATTSSGTGATGSSPFDGLAVDLYPSCAANLATNQDGDGWCDLLDNCPADVNEDQQDTDGDLQGNVCDADDDGDGVPDVDDNCPLAINPLQEDADGDEIGDVCDLDQDGDGINDSEDSCPTVPNPGAAQDADFDNDGLGDACDPNADMVLGFSATPNPVRPGQTITITATVQHGGPQTVQSAKLSLALPGAFALGSVSAGGWTCNSVPPGTNGAVLDCTDASFPPGTLTLSATGTASPLLVHGDNLTSSGVVTPSDLNPANSAMEFSVPVVVDSTDLGMDASGPGTEANVGDTLNYTAQVTNLGSRPAENVLISVARPTGTTFTAVTAPVGWSCTPAGPSLAVLECSTPSLSNGANATVQFSLLVGAGANGTLMQVSPTVSSDTPDSNASNDFDTITTAVGVVSEVVFANGFEG